MNLRCALRYHFTFIARTDNNLMPPPLFLPPSLPPSPYPPTSFSPSFPLSNLPSFSLPLSLHPSLSLQMSAHARYSEEDRERREHAVTVIQRTMRGHSSRKTAAAMRAERRVVMALQTLLSELSSPEMQAGGKSLLQVRMPSVFILICSCWLCEWL